MNLKTRIKELAAKAEAVTEFARGDFAIPALKKAGWLLTNSDDTTRAAQGKFSQASKKVLQDLLSDSKRPPIDKNKAYLSKNEIPFRVSNDRGRVIADYAKQGKDEMTGTRNQIARWLRANRNEERDIARIKQVVIDDRSR
jgi:hypothetical protein